MSCRCSFRPGDRVKMFSAIVKTDGKPVGIVHGKVENWPETGCHIVTWKETGLVTGLPNPNVELDLGSV
jgi:hypothetical protein